MYLHARCHVTAQNKNNMQNKIRAINMEPVYSSYVFLYLNSFAILQMYICVNIHTYLYMFAFCMGSFKTRSDHPISRN